MRGNIFKEYYKMIKKILELPPWPLVKAAFIYLFRPKLFIKNYKKYNVDIYKKLDKLREEGNTESRLRRTRSDILLVLISMIFIISFGLIFGIILSMIFPNPSETIIGILQIISASLVLWGTLIFNIGIFSKKKGKDIIFYIHRVLICIVFIFAYILFIASIVWALYKSPL